MTYRDRPERRSRRHAGSSNADRTAWTRWLVLGVVAAVVAAGLLVFAGWTRARLDADSAGRRAAEAERREQQLAKDYAEMRADAEAAKQADAKAAAARAAEKAAEKAAEIARVEAEKADAEAARAVQEAARRAESERQAEARRRGSAQQVTPGAGTPASSDPLKLVEAKCTGSCHQLSMFETTRVPEESATYVVDRMARQKNISLTPTQRRSIIDFLSE